MPEAHARRRQAACPPALSLKELLAAVDRRRGTRLELVCWQLDLDEPQVAPAWRLALGERLLAPRGPDPHTGETMFGLTERGVRALRRLEARRRSAPQRP